MHEPRLAQAHRVTLDLDQVLRATLAQRGTDIDDARRLLDTVGAAAVAQGIAEAPGDLTALTARLVDRLMIQDAERSVLWIKQAGAPEATPWPLRTCVIWDSAFTANWPVHEHCDATGAAWGDRHPGARRVASVPLKSDFASIRCSQSSEESAAF